MHRKTKRTQYWVSISPTPEDICGLNTWHTWTMTKVMLTLALCALGLVMIRSHHHRHFRPSHTPRWFASTPPIRESNGSDIWQPNYSDIACGIGADNVPAASKASNAAEHTEQICSQTPLSLPKCFRHPTVGPVCSCLNQTETENWK